MRNILQEITFIIGGCRSGKSRFALDFAEKSAKTHPIFIATSVPRDDEMKARVLKHQKERGQHWTTVEEPIQLSEVIMAHNKNENLILVDCITLWLNNLLYENNSPTYIDDHLEKVTHTLRSMVCPIIMVSNEVGQGIVPENKLARQFRDLAGSVNQALAACSDQVVWMVAGIPVFVKKTEL